MVVSAYCYLSCAFRRAHCIYGKFFISAFYLYTVLILHEFFTLGSPGVSPELPGILQQCTYWLSSEYPSDKKQSESIHKQQKVCDAFYGQL